MSTWFIDHHYADLTGLAGMAIIFGMLWPGAFFLMITGAKPASRLTPTGHEPPVSGDPSP